ncbi:MAG: hypothetical protein ACFCGT_21010 [Sandaracinaceae bacterium]
MTSFFRLALAGLIPLALVACADDGQLPEPPSEDAIQLDVAEDGSRFAFDQAPVDENGFPLYGNDFVTQGYLYPHGFLEDGPGVAEDGSPTAPDEVLGEWTCRGFFVGEGHFTESGPVVITTQVFDLYDEPGYAPGKASGRANVVSDGYELADVGVPTARSITGGTGPYRSAGGEGIQTLLGFNPSAGVDLRVTLDLDLD